MSSPNSLRRRLIAILVSLILASWLLAVGLTAYSAQETVRRQIDLRLINYLDLSQHTFETIQADEAISAFFRNRSVKVSDDGIVSRFVGIGTNGEDQATNMWFGRSQVLVGEKAPRFPRPEAEGIVTTTIGEGKNAETWRIIYRYEPQNRVWFGVGLNMENVGDQGVISLWRMVAPLIILLPVTIAILLWGVGRGLRPLYAMAEKIAARKPEALESIALDDVPLELMPLVKALNDLLDKLRRALASEKRFTANAAHELQTPLAAIQADLQRFQRQIQDSDSREMLSSLSRRVSRASSTVRQLLTLARLDPDQEFSRQSVDLSQLLMDELADLGDLAIERDIDFNLEGFDGQTRVTGNEEWLRILFRNLILNALRHSTASSEIDVVIASDEEGALVSIANDCNPICRKELARFTDRFYRRNGNREQGTGLGLSIAERIAQLHQARLSLGYRHDQQGFRADVLFTSGH